MLMEMKSPRLECLSSDFSPGPNTFPKALWALQWALRGTTYFWFRGIEAGLRRLIRQCNGRVGGDLSNDVFAHYCFNRTIFWKQILMFSPLHLKWLSIVTKQKPTSSALLKCIPMLSSSCPLLQILAFFIPFNLATGTFSSSNDHVLCISSLP